MRKMTNIELSTSEYQGMITSKHLVIDQWLGEHHHKSWLVICNHIISNQRDDDVIVPNDFVATIQWDAPLSIFL